MHTNAIESISHVGQTCMRGMPASSLSSEFCTVQVLEVPNKLFTLQNSKVPTLGSILKYCINGASIGTVSSGLISKVTAIGRCLLRDALLP